MTKDDRGFEVDREGASQTHDQDSAPRPLGSAPLESLSLLEIVGRIYQHKFIVAMSAAIFGLVGILLAVLLTPVYEAEALLAPARAERNAGGLAALAGQFDALASVAGVNVDAADIKHEAVAVLKSQRFTRDFIQEKNLMPILFEKEWDDDRGSWKEDIDEIPSFADAYELFEEIRSIEEDTRTGFVRLAIRWEDPLLAAEWVNDLIQRLNEYMRDAAISEAQRSISFLHRELEKTSIVELRQSIFGLIEEQIATAMVANVRAEYAFRVLDPAIPPDRDRQVWPKRKLIVVLAVATGIFFGFFLALFFGLRNEKRGDA